MAQPKSWLGMFFSRRAWLDALGVQLPNRDNVKVINAPGALSDDPANNQTILDPGASTVGGDLTAGTVSNATVGKLLGVSLDGATMAAPTHGQVAQFDGATGKWKSVPRSSPALAPPSTGLVLAAMPDTIVKAPNGVGSYVVPRWADKSGLGQDFVQATTARQPKYVAPSASRLAGFAGVQTGNNGAGLWATSTLLSALNTNSSTLYVLVQHLADGVGGTKTFLGVDASVELDRFEFPLGSGNVTPILNYPFPPATQALFASHILQPVLYALVGDGTHQTLYANGVQVAQAAAAAHAFSAILLGSTNPGSDAFSTPNIFFELLAYNVSHTATQLAQVGAYFANKYGCQIVFDGNSQFKGDHSTGLGTSIPGFTPHIVSGLWSLYVNNGTNGITTPNLTARMSTTVGLFNPLVARRVMVMLEVENDLVANGASATPTNTTYATGTAWNNIIAYSRAARAAGVPALVVCTGLPIGSLIPPPNNYENSRQALNALIRANWNAIDATTGRPYFDALADIGGPTSAVGVVAATSNGAYYDQTDQTHLNDGGVAASAPTIAAAIVQALAA